MATRRGYILPDDPTPEGYYCIPVRVPHDEKYLYAFFGALDFFGKWLAWDDGGDGRAAQAAAIWKAANEITRSGFEAGECGLSFQLRQNPSNLCQLQQSIDGGETWTLAFDYSKCGVKTPPPTGTIDRAAGFIRGFHEPLIERVIDLCIGDRDDAIANLTDWIRTYDPGYANPTALGQLFDEVCALSPEEQADLTTDCSWIAEYESLSECDSIEAWYDWLDCIAETLGSTLDTWSTAISNALNNAAAALGLGGIGAFTNGGGAGGGSGFGTTCDETCYDFLASDGGWYATTPPGEFAEKGVWFSDEGWQSESGAFDSWKTFIRLPNYTTTKSIGRVEIEVSYTNADNRTALQVDGVEVAVLEDLAVGTHTVIFEADDAWAADWIRVYSRQQSTNVGHYITEICVYTAEE